jgi:hypothetical protein
VREETAVLRQQESQRLHYQSQRARSSVHELVLVRKEAAALREKLAMRNKEIGRARQTITELQEFKGGLRACGGEGAVLAACGGQVALLAAQLRVAQRHLALMLQDECDKQDAVSYQVLPIHHYQCTQAAGDIAGDSNARGDITDCDASSDAEIGGSATTLQAREAQRTETCPCADAWEKSVTAPSVVSWWWSWSESSSASSAPSAPSSSCPSWLLSPKTVSSLSVCTAVSTAALSVLSATCVGPPTVKGDGNMPSSLCSLGSFLVGGGQHLVQALSQHPSRYSCVGNLLHNDGRLDKGKRPAKGRWGDGDKGVKHSKSKVLHKRAVF